jgi:uncharacterized protein YabN with tetrapyrrole methylase and pyrophosphatase domain
MPAALSVVGCGLQFGPHLTVGARRCIEKAEKLLFLVTNGAAAAWLTHVNPSAESLADCYGLNQYRGDAYEAMVERIMLHVRKGVRVCVVSYGHPGVFADPMHESIRRARAEGYEAEMLPGISAEDCMFADLGLDPAEQGMQSYDATDFLVQPRRFDTASGLILWQLLMAGDLTHKRVYNRAGVAALTMLLVQHYGPDHEVVLYSGTEHPMANSVIVRVPLRDLMEAPISLSSTLYVPPKGRAALDRAMVAHLGLESEVART